MPKKLPSDRLPEPKRDPLLDDRVLTLAEWRKLNALPERSARRILRDPDPKKRPVLTQLSPRRYGVTVRANREWQERRAR
jgi:hypothetical protein